MYKFRVKIAGSQSGPVEIEALSMEASAAGFLVFKDATGDVIAAFPAHAVSWASRGAATAESGSDGDE